MPNQEETGYTDISNRDSGLDNAGAAAVYSSTVLSPRKNRLGMSGVTLVRRIK